MKRLPACLLLTALLGACSSASLHDASADARAADVAAAQALVATAPPPGEPLAPWLEAQRTRIATAQAQATQRFADAEKACWRRFAVNVCVREARAERRTAIDRLRQEELAVNGLERQRAADVRLRELELKQSPAASP